MRNLLLSTAIGDISGKPYESRRTRTKDYDSVDLLLPENTYSDDTVCTISRLYGKVRRRMYSVGKGNRNAHT